MVSRKASEVARVGVLALAAAWLLHPFATARRCGGGDALWYAQMLGDFVTQVRHGFFPVFAGQTDFAFNGAVYPLRVAPLYQHLAALLDLLTLHSLGIFALQHLTVIACGVAGLFGTYATLCWIAPSRRWAAVGFSVLYLSCPGVLATVYAQDLYMTWMTVALAPFAAYGIVRSFRHDDLRSQLVLGASLASLWWAHSPIALWFTLVAAASQLVRLAAARAPQGSIARCLAGALVFAVLAQYPFVSVASLGSPGDPSAASVPLDNPGAIAEHIRSAFPAALLPVGTDVSGLGALQLGYGLWAVFLASLGVVSQRRRLDLAVLLGASGLLLFLIFPVPVLNRLIWGSMPGAVIRITYYWPMQRFYLIAAALLAAAGQIACDEWSSRSKGTRILFAISLSACCSWSLLQARPFLLWAEVGTSSAADTARSLRPENRILMDHAYGLFAGLPPHFSNGVVDPRSEARLVPSPSAVTQGRLIQSGPLAGKVDANPGILDLHPALHLDPDRRYQVKIVSSHGGVPGILQCIGRTFFREYRLPSSGEALSFGTGPSNSPFMDLWTTDPAGDDVEFRFIPDQPGPKAAALAAFGSFEFRELTPGDEPVEVTALEPFTARVRTQRAALLETPRMYMPGYLATVDARPVAPVRSSDSLTEIEVPAGEHVVTLAYQGPLLLRISYWGALLGWAGAILLLVFKGSSVRN
jgi:hypothetical protein